jgi:hypothetical protein
MAEGASSPDRGVLHVIASPTCADPLRGLNIASVSVLDKGVVAAHKMAGADDVEFPLRPGSYVALANGRKGSVDIRAGQSTFVDLPCTSLPIRISGLRITKVSVSLALYGGSTEIAQLLRADIDDASSIAGLASCAPLPPDVSSMPELPGFSCGASPSFTAASLRILQRLRHLEGISARFGDRSTSLDFLGVLRGEPALIVQPIGRVPRILTDLVVLRGLPGVLKCEWSGTDSYASEDTIACSTTSHAAALSDQKAAWRLNVAYAEAFSSW